MHRVANKLRGRRREPSTFRLPLRFTLIHLILSKYEYRILLFLLLVCSDINFNIMTLCFPGDSKSLATRLAVWVEVWFLAEGYDTVTNTALVEVVEGGSVEVGSVVPNGKRVLQNYHYNYYRSYSIFRKCNLGRTFSHLKRTWRSWLSCVSLKRCPRIASDSSRVTPRMRFVKLGFTKTDFQPVTGFVRMTGWTASRWFPTLPGDPRVPARSLLPKLLAMTWKKRASWTASRVSKYFAKEGERRS